MIVGADEFSTRTKYSVLNVTLHPYYYRLGGDYNIAVLRTRWQISIGLKVGPASISPYSIAAYEAFLVNVSALQPMFSKYQLRATRVPTVYCTRQRENYYPKPTICAGYLDRINNICKVSTTNEHPTIA